MVIEATEIRIRTGATEKLTINLGVVDLGQIDLLVQEGFYSNRTDLIRAAIRNQLGAQREEVKRTVAPRGSRRAGIRDRLGVHREEVKRTVARRALVLGLQNFSRADLERVRAGAG